jgi:hypothetical protein
MKIHAFVFNWKGQEANAVALEAELGRCAKVSVINSDDAIAPAHPGWFNLDDSAYFAAQWNKAAEVFDGDLLLHLQADAHCDDVPLLFERVESVFARLPVGVYEPNIEFNDLALDRQRLRVLEPDLHVVPGTDSTCWCIRREVVRALPPVDIANNRLGWGICPAIAAIARLQGLVCVRDYRLTVRHTPGRGYSSASAIKQRARYIASLPADVRAEVVHVFDDYRAVMDPPA